MTNFFKLDNFLFDSNIIGISSFSKYLINFKISLKEFIENNKPEIFISPEFIDENNNFNVYDITNATIDQKIKCLINHRRGGTIKILKKILEKSDNEDIIKILSDQRIYERLIISYDEFCINDDEQWKNYSGIKDKLGVIFMESLNIDYKNNLFVHPSSKSILIEEKKEKNEEEKREEKNEEEMGYPNLKEKKKIFKLKSEYIYSAKHQKYIKDHRFISNKNEEENIILFFEIMEIYISKNMDKNIKDFYLTLMKKYIRLCLSITTHLAINKKIYNFIKNIPEFEEYKKIRIFFLWYVYKILTDEEIRILNFANDNDRYIIKSEDASNLEYFSSSEPEINPYVANITNNSSLYKNIIYILEDKPRKICSFLEFKKKFDFLTNNIFDGIENLHEYGAISGGIVNCCNHVNPFFNNDDEFKKYADEFYPNYDKVFEEKDFDYELAFEQRKVTSDIDFHIFSKDENDFNKKAEEIFAKLLEKSKNMNFIYKSKTEEKLRMIKTENGTTKSKHYFVIGPVLQRPIEFYPIFNSENQTSRLMAKYHLSAVKSWTDYRDVYFTISCVCSLLSGYITTIYFQRFSINPEIIFEKYIRRGFSFIVGENLRKIIVEHFDKKFNFKFDLEKPLLLKYNSNFFGKSDKISQNNFETLNEKDYVEIVSVLFEKKIILMKYRKIGGEYFINPQNYIDC